MARLAEGGGGESTDDPNPSMHGAYPERYKNDADKLDPTGANNVDEDQNGGGGPSTDYTGAVREEGTSDNSGDVSVTGGQKQVSRENTDAKEDAINDIRANQAGYDQSIEAENSDEQNNFATQTKYKDGVETTTIDPNTRDGSAKDAVGVSQTEDALAVTTIEGTNDSGETQTSTTTTRKRNVSADLDPNNQQEQSDNTSSDDPPDNTDRAEGRPESWYADNRPAPGEGGPRTKDRGGGAGYGRGRGRGRGLGRVGGGGPPSWAGGGRGSGGRGSGGGESASGGGLGAVVPDSTAGKAAAAGGAAGLGALAYFFLL